MILNYETEKESNLYDFTTMKEILGVNKSKLHREIHRLPVRDFVKYKNQHLYNETTLFLLMEKLLFERIKKIDEEYELPKSKTDQ